VLRLRDDVVARDHGGIVTEGRPVGSRS
jgi:hypothetical protein